jgi:hypothetical protein
MNNRVLLILARWLANKSVRAKWKATGTQAKDRRDR